MRIGMPYAELSEQEKDRNREQVVTQSPEIFRLLDALIPVQNLVFLIMSVLPDTMNLNTRR